MLSVLLWGAIGLQSHPDLGKAEGRCIGEDGSRFLVEVEGLKDRSGTLKLELYPANDADFLAPDFQLLAARKAFARVERHTAGAGTVTMCIRAPGPGIYSLAVLHDRDLNRRFSLSKDGIGFAGNPRLGWSKPRAAAAAAQVGNEATRLRIVLNYRRGPFSFGPLPQ